MANQNAQTPLLAAYLVVGEDELKKEAVLERLEKRLATMGDLSFNSDRFSGESATGEEIVIAANTLPFASEIRLVRVDDVEKLRKADSEALVSYLEAPAPTTLLLLVANKLAKNTRLYKAVAKVGKQAVIDCAPPNRRDMTSQVTKMGRTHGISITPAAANALVDLVGLNTVAIDSELRKLALAHRGSDPVNENEVFGLVARTAEVKPWEIVDAFAGRNIERCLTLLDRKGKISAHALMAMCVTRIRELVTTKALGRRGESRELARVLKMPDWKVRNYGSWSRNFTMEELVEALSAARDAEQRMKSGYDPDDVFLDWLVATLRR